MFLHFEFDPPKWEEGTMSQGGVGADGYFLNRTFELKDISPIHLPALNTVVQRIVALGEEWQATSVWARKSKYIINQESASYGDCIELEAEVRNTQNGRYGVFTSKEYDCLRIIDTEALEFFDYYSKYIPE